MGVLWRRLRFKFVSLVINESRTYANFKSTPSNTFRQLHCKRSGANGDVERCNTYLADSYTIHHDPGDPWDGQSLDIAGFKTRVRQSRAPFPDQRFHVLEMLSDERKVDGDMELEGDTRVATCRIFRRRESPMLAPKHRQRSGCQ